MENKLENTYENFSKINPVYVLSIVLAALFEAALLVVIIFIITITPINIVDKEPIIININLNQIPANITPTIEKPVEKPIENPIKQFDPIFEAIQTFQPQQPKVESASFGLKPSNVEVSNNPINTPAGVFDTKDIRFDVIRNVPIEKRMVNVLETIEQNVYDILRFEDLKSFNFPNFDTVRESLGRDYQQLLSRSSITALQNLRGDVLVGIILQKDGTVDIQVKKSPSLELSSIVIKNLKLLRAGLRLEPLHLDVSISFVME